jgi:homospermidine synthase
MNFKDIGNTKDSKNYKDILKKVFKDMVVDVREKIMSNNLLDAVKNLDIKQIEDKVKDKLKNKLKGLIN